jgi:tripartite ATP-independent transporter DctP family solute receptor
LAEVFLKASGLRVLGWAENGYRHFTNNSKPIRSPADMKGLKIRVMESPAYVNMVKGLGANPTPIAWTELYSALQQKVVDGQENPINNILSAKLYEVQKYLTLDGHTYSVHGWIMNNEVWKSLTDKNKRIVKDAARVAVVAHRAANTMADVKGLEILAKAGVHVYAPTGAELDKFRSMAQPPVEEFLKTKIKPVWLEKLKKSTADVEARTSKVE